MEHALDPDAEPPAPGGFIASVRHHDHGECIACGEPLGPIYVALGRAEHPACAPARNADGSSP